MASDLAPSPLAAADEERHWRTLAAAAARDLPEGRVGGVIAQLRQRGRVATRRANVFLGFLLATVIIGLGYYIGLPLWRAYADGTIRTWQDQVDAARADGLALDEERHIAAEGLREALALAPSVVRGAAGEALYPPVRLADGALVVSGIAGSVLRSTDGGRTWVDTRPPSPTGGHHDAVILLPDGTLMLTGQWGLPFRSEDGGANWAESPLPETEGPFAAPLALSDGTLLAMSRSGAVFRSVDRGATWPEVGRVAADAGDEFWRPDQLADGSLIVMARSGAILRSDDLGVTWRNVGVLAEGSGAIGTLYPLGGDDLMIAGPYGTSAISVDGGAQWRPSTYPGERIGKPVAIGEGVFVATVTGGICLSEDGGFTWRPSKIASSKMLFDDAFLPVAEMPAGGLISVSNRGAILFSDDEGRSWRETFSGDRAFNAPLLLGSTVVVNDDGGRFLRSTDGGRTWSEARPASPSKESFSAPVILADGRLLAAGGAGTILRSVDGGETWLEVRERSATGEGFSPPEAIAGEAPVATGSDGTILRFAADARLEETIARLPPGETGDAALVAFGQELAPEVRDAPSTAAALRELEAIASKRAPIDGILANATARLDAWRSGAAAPEVRRAAFAAFMQSCRAGAEEPEDASLTIACLQAYAASEGNTEREWWQAVAEQAPQGILLLFLLATLSGLYRYNLRLAGFHNGRADALELIVAQIDKDLLTPVSDALAADKVEFGAAKTPADHAAEMATAVINRAKL